MSTHNIFGIPSKIVRRYVKTTQKHVLFTRVMSNGILRGYLSTDQSNEWSYQHEVLELYDGLDDLDRFIEHNIHLFFHGTLIAYDPTKVYEWDRDGKLYAK